MVVATSPSGSQGAIRPHSVVTPDALTDCRIFYADDVAGWNEIEAQQRDLRTLEGRKSQKAVKPWGKTSAEPQTHERSTGSHVKPISLPYWSSLLPIQCWRARNRR